MVTWEGMAWFFMSEGAFSLDVDKRPDKGGLGYVVAPDVMVCNTEMEMIKGCTKWLTQNGIDFHISTGKSKNYTIYRIRIGWKSLAKFLKSILPFMVGRKLKVTELLLEFLGKYPPVIGGGLSVYDRKKARINAALDYREKIHNLNMRFRPLKKSADEIKRELNCSIRPQPTIEESTLRELYLENGKSVYEIAEYRHVDPSTVSYWLGKYGIKARGVSKLDKLRKKFVAMREAHASYREIAGKLDIGQSTIISWRRRLNLPKYRNIR